MLDNTPMYTVARQALPAEVLLNSAPAAFAETPDTTRTSKHYRFISTARVIEALQETGFAPTRAQQTRVRGGGSPAHAKHMIRFSHLRTSLSMVDAIPELILINSHNATSPWILRAGIYRPLCTNGLITQIGDFGLVYVPHRGNILTNVVEAALQIMDGFGDIGRVLKQLANRTLTDQERWDFAAQALRMRYPKPEQHIPLSVDQLLLPRRDADYGNSAWLVYNVVQENLVAGGLQGRAASGRASRTRGIRAIAEEVRLNVALWDSAVALLNR